MLRLARFETLRSRLLLLVAVAVLPLALFALAGVVSLAKAQREDYERSLAELVRALGSAVDAELQRNSALLDALSASPLLATGDLAGFHALASTVENRQPNWAALVLGAPDGRYLLNTSVPFGTQLPARVTDTETLRLAQSSRSPIVGRLIEGQLTGDPLFTVAAPVRASDELLYVLFATVRPESLREILARQHVPEEATVAVLDRNRRVVARSRQHEQFVGRPATDSLQAIMRGRSEGVGTSRTLDGKETFTVFSSSPLTGWTVVIGIPLEQLGTMQERAYAVLLLGLLASLLLGGLAAFLISGRIVRPIMALRQSALAIGRGEPVPVPSSSLHEIQDVGRSLTEASQRLREAEQLRGRVLEAEQQARLSAENANREKDEFLAMLGHELRNPLAAINNAFELLCRLPPQEERVAPVRQIMARQIRHLKHLVDDLLDVSRIMTGKIVLARELLDVAVVVEEAIRSLEQAGALKEHPVGVNASSAWLMGDAVRLQQVVSNLIANAAKYSPSGSRIEVRAGPVDGGQVQIEVTDQGVGMEPQVLERVFDLFYQAGVSADRGQGGLGVGLTLSKRLVELHGGTIGASSGGAGRGSCFTVRLPQAAAPQVAQPDVAKQGSAGASRRVLVVDDNRDGAETLKVLLELDGHSVSVAYDGGEAVAKAAELRPEIILLDLGLPVLDGHAACRAIRDLPIGQEVGIIAVSGWGQPADRERSMQSGFDAHLTKPVGYEELVDALSRVLRERRGMGSTA